MSWFSGFLLFTTGGLLFRFWGGNVDFLFWRFAVCNWATWRTSSLLGSSTVGWLNLLDVLIWKSILLPSLTISLDLQRHIVKKILIYLNTGYLDFGSYHVCREKCLYYYQNYTCSLLISWQLDSSTIFLPSRT